MGGPFEIILSIVVMSFWFLFPLGMIIAERHLDKNTDKVVQLGRLEESTKPSEPRTIRIPVRVEKRPIWRPHVASIHLRRGIRH